MVGLEVREIQCGDQRTDKRLPMQVGDNLTELTRVTQMRQEPELTQKRFGLIANGCSGRWEVAIDELIDSGAVSMEIDSGSLYFTFHLSSLTVVRKLITFLKVRRDPNDRLAPASMDLGHFGSSAVSMIWDDEEVARCFLVVGPDAQSALRLSLDAEDIQMLIVALKQVVDDLPRNANESGG